MIEHSKEDVEKIVEPYIEGLRECVHEAWSLWRASDHAAHLYWKTVMGNAMCNYFLKVATHSFYGKSSHIRVEVKRPYVGLYIESSLYLRFKKSKRNLRTGNVQTKSAKTFFNKSQPIEALEGLTRLELVYVPTRDGIDIECIMLVCKDQGRVAWTIDLLARAEPEQAIINMPQQPTPQGSPAERVIKKTKDRANDHNRREAGKGS